MMTLVFSSNSENNFSSLASPDLIVVNFNLCSQTSDMIQGEPYSLRDLCLARV